MNSLKKWIGPISLACILCAAFICFGWIVGVNAAKSKNGKERWTCSMDPEVRLSKAGKCPVCGMDLIVSEQIAALESTDSLSFTMTEAAIKLAEPPTTLVQFDPSCEDGKTDSLVIPSRAVVREGGKMYVYVRDPWQLVPTFEARMVTIFAHHGQMVKVGEGLAMGEEVITNAAFFMPLTGVHPTQAETFARVAPNFNAHFSTIVPTIVGKATESWMKDMMSDYVRMEQAIGIGAHNRAAQAASDIVLQIANPSLDSLDPQNRSAWNPIAARVKSYAGIISGTKLLGHQRKYLDSLSLAIFQIGQLIGGGGDSLFLLRCRLAFHGEGGCWLSRSRNSENPYFPLRAKDAQHGMQENCIAIKGLLPK